MFFRPVGTIEESPRNTEFARPYGTPTIVAARIPSSELLGNYQVSLRDGVRPRHLCRTTTALPWATKLWPFGPKSRSARS